MEAIPIPDIEPGKYADITFRWALPQLLSNYPDQNFHFCLLGKIMEVQYDDGYEEGKVYFNIQGSNNQAQKNITIIKRSNLSKEVNVFVRNVSSTAQKYTLELVPQTPADAKLYEKGNAELELSPKVYAAWERGGLQAQEVEMPSANANGAALRTVKLVSPQSKLQTISLNGDEFDVVKLKFNFNQYFLASTSYNFDLIQRDENGNIVGGETFIVEAPVYTYRPIEISSTDIGNGQYELGIDSTGITNVEWTNEQNEIIGNSETVTVTPKINSNKYQVTATDQEGCVTTESISLEENFGIESIALTADGGTLTVNLHNNAPANASISIVSLLDGTQKTTQNIPGTTSSITVDTSNLHNGAYAVVYSAQGELIDQKKFNK